MDGIGSCQNRSPRIESGRDACLCHTDCLLLHCFVNGHSVGRLHFIEFVNTNNPAICKHQGSSLNLKLSCYWVLVYTGSQTGSRWPLSWSIHCNRWSLLDKFEELRLGCRWVSYKQNVYISSQPSLIRKMFSWSSEEHASNSFLDFLIPVYSRCDAIINDISAIWIPCQFFKVFHIGLSVVETSPLLHLTDISDVDIPLGQIFSFELTHKHHTRHHYPVPRNTARNVITVCHQRVGPSYLTSWNILRILLDF